MHSVPTKVQNLVGQICSHFFGTAIGKFQLFFRIWLNCVQNWATALISGKEIGDVKKV